ncbi:MAG: M48 family metallopeptidase [Ignavibacteriae bacterium]|nr:M48 family metallopeptidase [Ignavibacteriota bacterium]MCB9216551.1 M48 family metallopeptidase [Ignavibacteria bacterium]
MAIKRTHFPDISPKSWQHPADRAALAALKKVPGLDMLLQKVVGGTTERSLRLIHLASAVRVGDTQFPKVHKLHKEACAIFNVEKMPELYIAQTPLLNASAIGVNNPFIVLNSSMIDALDEEELLCVIGHELGHCVSGHVLYKTLLAMLIQFSVYFMSIPLGSISIAAIIAALREWDRKSELSADRAGLLTVQNPDVSYNLLMKMAGGPRIEQMDTNEFFLQAAEYQKGGNLIDSIYKLMNLLSRSHPFAVLRLTELKTWVDNGSYGKILGGDYMRMDEAEKRTVQDEFTDAKEQYKQDINSSEDPLAEIARTMMGAAGAATDKAKEVFDSIFGNGGK